MKWAVTGAGMITCQGSSPDACFAGLCAGTGGPAAFEAFPASHFNTPLAHEIRDRPDGRDRPLRCTAWLIEAIRQAVVESGLQTATAAAAPLVVGTGLRELRTDELWATASAAPGGPPHDVRAALFGGTRPPAAPQIVVCNACAAGLHAVAIAADMLTVEDVDVVVVAAADSLTLSMVGLSDRANHRAGGVDRVQPFDRDRRGVLLGEGAAAIVLERPDSARRRAARPLAWLRSVGASCDAEHETAPSPAGQLAAMRDAHRRAGVAPHDVDVLFAHGTGTALNDVTEIGAFRECFGASAGRVAITALKAQTGHTSGASGLMSFVAAMAAFRHGLIPPIAGLEQPLVEGSGLDFVAPRPRQRTVRIAQVHAFGFGGVNAVAVLEHPG